MIALVVSLMAAAVLQAQPAAPTPTAKADKKICRSEMPTGSMMAKRTCHTKAEWDEISEASQRDIDAARRNSANAGGGIPR